MIALHGLSTGPLLVVPFVSAENGIQMALLSIGMHLALISWKVIKP